MKKYLLWITVLAALTGFLCLSAAAVDVTLDVPVAAVDGTEYTTLAAALNAYNSNAQAESVQLLADADSLDWALIRDTVLDLNGYTVAKNNTTGAKLLVKDSQTDDYTVEDTYGYGSIPTGGNVTPCAGYYQIDEGGSATFHRLSLDLTSVNLKLEKMGIYYTTEIGGDEKIKAIVSEYGVAVRAYKAPDANSLAADTAKRTHVSWGQASWQTGAPTGDNSVLIYDIMKPRSSADLNSRWAKISIYAACYIKVGEEIVWGEPAGYSLRDVVEAAQSNDAYKTQLEGMLATYRGTMINWDIPNVRGDRPIKILMIGQSHAQDSSWLVYEVLKAQMPDQEFLVADTYKSTNLKEHVYNIKNEVAGYNYYEFSESGSYTLTTKFTINQAVVQHDWDLIVFNEATWPQVDEKEHTDGDFQFMTDYIKANATPGYKIAYNATWAQPTSAGLYDADNGRRQETTVSFRKSFTEKFAGSRLAHFAEICRLINRYVEPDPDYDMVIHSGTAIQYASETLGVAECDPTWTFELYRDYTHLGDFGRLLVAYQWYAQIFGIKELKSVDVQTIAQAMRVTGAEGKGDITVTDDMREAIIASVNYALKHPNEAPPQTARENPILEPLTSETA